MVVKGRRKILQKDPLLVGSGGLAVGSRMSKGQRLPSGAAQRRPETIVVAAGGIAEGRGLAAALALGAEGVLVGTRFFASVESLVQRVDANRKRMVYLSTGTLALDGSW
jgi:nitronate monooxygenase